jgi:hypothetical protein
VAVAFRTLSGHDNDSYYFEDSDVPACVACGLVSDAAWINPRFRLERREFDLSSTYDGATIASERFVECASEHSGVRFQALPDVDGFYLMIVEPIVRVDRTDVRVMEDLCETCARFKAIAGPPRRLLPGERIPAGFSRSDVEFGSAHVSYQRYRKIAQKPILIVDPALGQQLESQRFRGMSIKSIEA